MKLSLCYQFNLVFKYNNYNKKRVKMGQNSLKLSIFITGQNVNWFYKKKYETEQKAVEKWGKIR